MPLILVVEQDLGVVSRLRRAFSEEEGWRVRHVRSTDEAVDVVGSEAPDLFVVSTEIDGAEKILGPYARRRGGPGTLALVSQSADATAPPDAASLGADAAVAKPITEEAVRAAAENILKTGNRPAAAPLGAGEPKLTSNDIFGDLVAEVERDAEQRAWRRTPAPSQSPPAPAEPAAPPPATPRAQGPAEPPAPTRPQTQAPPQTPTAPRPPQAAVGQNLAARGRTTRPSLTDEDIERRLERTLSGVLSGSPRPKAPKAPSAQAPPGTAQRPTKSPEADLEALISKTLSGIELPKRKKPAAPTAAPTPSADSATAPAAAAGAATPRPTSPPSPPSPPPIELPVAPVVPEEAEELDLDLELEISGLDLPVVEPPAAAEEPSSPAFEPPAASVAAPLAALGEAPPEHSPSMTSPAQAEVPDIPFRPEFAETFEEVAEPVASLDLVEEATGQGGLPSGTSSSPQQAPASQPAAESGGDGVVFGQYRLLERIGVGGMAEVWKARMTGVEGFQKIVAIKKILPHLTDSSDFVEMFIDEAKLAAQLNHANIIHIYDLGKIDGDYYIAMEYVAGQNLRAILNSARDRGRPLPVGLALFIAARLASALDHAHRKRDFEDRSLDLVHRDVSPQNVLLGYEGTIKLCDFGIVKAVSKSSHTRMGALKGKLQYMSPEQAWGRSVDARSDIFAVGILLFEMLTGRRLFRGESELEVLEAVRECRVQAPGEIDPSVSREVDAIVLKALSKDPEERYQSAGELVRRLEEALVSMRPSPGQPELADYMSELFGRGGGESGVEGTDSVELSAPVGVAGGTASLTAPRPEESQSPPLEIVEPEPVEPMPAAAPPSIGLAETADEAPQEPPLMLAEERPATGEGAAEPTAGAAATVAIRGLPSEVVSAPAAEPVELVTDVELEEGGRPGRGLLVGAILVALLIAALLYWFVWRPRLSSDGAVTTPEGAPTEIQGSAAAAPPFDPATAVQGDVAEPSALTTAAGGPPVGELGEEPAAQDPAAAEAGHATDEGTDLRAMVERSLDEELAQKEEELRRQFEAKERELAERLAAAQQRAAEPKPSPAKVPEPKPTKTAQPSAPPPAPERPTESARPEGEHAVEDSGGEAADPPDASRRFATSATGESPAPGGSRATPAAMTRPDGAAVSSVKTRSPEPEAEPKPEPPPPPKPAVTVGDLVEMGPGVMPPQLVSISKPEYPPVARRLGVEGTVVVSVLVSEDGNVLDTRLDQGVSRKVGLNEAALEAARRAKYRPATKDGVRVKMWTTLKIPFRL